jgi:hypothetical protein
VSTTVNATDPPVSDVEVPLGTPTVTQAPSLSLFVTDTEPVRSW